MSERIDVFISSTSRDLPEHRNQAMDACLRMGMFPIMMEHLPASDADAIEASLKMVDDAEIYLGIFAWRYGYIPAGHNISITEMEYHRAVERGIPRLIFVMHDDHPVKGPDVEKGASAAKLEVLKKRLLTEQVVNFFKSPEELRGQIIHSLVPHRVPDPGSLHSRYASEIPFPPEPYIAHPYTLLQTKDLIGRQKELDMLTQWATQSEAAVFNFVVAIGGMGKSALTWKWFNDIAPNVMPNLAGRMWWSFYESDASFDNFIIRALAYVSRQPKEEIENLSPSEREAQLLAILDKEPFLLVWDGFERTMIAYARMDAARMTDDDLDEKTANYVSNRESLPESRDQSFAGKHQLRKTADPRIGTLLRKLLRMKKSRILVSTRLYPAEFQSVTGQALQGSEAYFLRGLSDNDAFHLWQAYGVSGSHESVLRMFHSFANYPLLIRALAGEVANYRRAPGNFDQWRQAHPDFNPFDLSMKQAKSHVLSYALQGLDDRLQKLLHIVAAFRAPPSYDVLVVLLVGPDKPFSDEHELDNALIILEDRGLLGWDKRSNRYDVHPVVRGVVWNSLDEVAQHAIYSALEAYFGSLPLVPLSEVNSLEDLTETIELYNALAAQERFDEARRLFSIWLSRATLHRLSANRQRAELLEMLFPDGVEHLPRLSAPDDQAWTLNALAQSYKLSGRPRQAIPLYRRGLEMAADAEDQPNLSIGLFNLADTLRLVGLLYDAEFAGRQAVKVSRAEGDLWGEAGGLVMVGLVYVIRGRTLEAEIALTRTLRIFALTWGNAQLEAVAHAFLAQRALWLGLHDVATSQAEKAWQLAISERNEHDCIRAARLQGRAALATGEISRADERLTHALKRARGVNFIAEEVQNLIGLAELERLGQHFEEARELLQDIWELAERGPYPLFHADALSVLAQIEPDEGNTNAAIEAATQAYELAWCDGPPYAYHWGLETAKKHLDELGAPYPDMPRFDPSKYEPMPEVEIDPPDEFSG